MIQIIPAIDIIDGKCVRLSMGDYDQKKIYHDDPLKVALDFEEHGIKRLHLVDLDGAKENHVVNWKVLEKITSKTGLIVDFGGGIKSDTDIDIVFKSGAKMATIGSVAVKNKELFFTWLNKYGSDKIILGADVKDRKIAVAGWLEVTGLDIIDFLNEYLGKGVKQVLCTDISKDGMMQGTSFDLYKEIMDKFPEIELIASGGVTSIDEIPLLDRMNISGVIIGKAIYEGKISLADIESYIG
jgi:phosphoribosylformimino-5-aminoimidazole carboxamide ribotide isomerase